MLVRSAHPSDADGCVNVLALLPEYFTSSTHDEVRRGISDHMALVADVDGTVVGFMLIERRHRRSAEVSYSAVQPAYRNQGIGSLLLAAAVDGLRADGVVLVEAKTLDATAGDAVPAATAESSIPAAQSSATTMPEVVAIVGVYDSVEAYPACGNETFDHLGVTWYPLVHEGLDPMSDDLQVRADKVFAVKREPSPVVGAHGLARVVSPGPGDDIGTLVVWADGVARWVSDSRDLDVWLVDEPISYSWVC